MLHKIKDTAKSIKEEWRAGFRSALVIGILAISFLLYAYLTFRMVGDRPRGWQYRSAPFIPAESYLSTNPVPASTTAPKQVELPPATVGKKAK